MEKTFAARLIEIGIFVIFCVLVFFSIKQVDHLEKLVLSQKETMNELDRTVSRMAAQLESGDFAAGSRSTTDGTGDPAIDYHRRYYTDAEWELLNRPGNLLSPRTNRWHGPDAQDGGVMQRAFINDVPQLNYVVENAADVSELWGYIGGMLATRQRNDPDRWVPDLAVRVEPNDDYTQYHVWLKEGVYWHEPAVDLSDSRYAWLAGDHEVVADDFVFFMELVKNDQVEAGYLTGYFENFERIEVIDEHEFIVHWIEPEYTSISTTLATIYPVPRWLFGFDEDGNAYDESEIGRRFNTHWYNSKMLGMGPYRFVDWQQGGRISIERNERYHFEKPPIEQIEFRIIADATALLNNLRAGELDFARIEPTQYRNEIVQGGTPGFENGELEWDTFQRTTYRYLGWNADGKFFNDRRVRLAMTHALNRELTIEANMHGLGQIISGHFYIDGPDYNHDVQPWPYDLDRAAELLSEAGWEDRNGDGIREKVIDGQTVRFEFGMVTYGYRPEFIAAMEIYRNDLRRIGVVMNIEPVEWSVMIQRMNEKDFDAYTGGWVLGWDTDLYQIWHSSQADIPRGSNRVGFRSEEGDRIIEESRRTFTSEGRQALFHRFHEILHEEQPYTFWFAGRQVIGWNARMNNVSFSPIRPFDLSVGWDIEQN